jgi:hypothetical protein
MAITARTIDLTGTVQAVSELDEIRIKRDPVTGNIKLMFGFHRVITQDGTATSNSVDNARTRISADAADIAAMTVTLAGITEPVSGQKLLAGLKKIAEDLYDSKVV